MIWLNTYWTWQYVVMLLFVFVTAWGTLKIVLNHHGWFSYKRDSLVAAIWAAGATFFFHQVW